MKNFKNILLATLLFIQYNAFGQYPIELITDSLAIAYLKNHSGALIVGIKTKGIQKVYYYGETERGNKKLPDSTSIFEIGALSETFTAVLYADMTVKGIIKSDDKLKDYLPVNVPSPVYQNLICKPVDENHNNMFSERERYQVNYTPYVCFPDPSSHPQQILLCDLGTHTTGFPEFPDNLKVKRNKQNPFSNYTMDNLYDFLKGYSFNNPLGYDYKHSSLGITLLGHALTLKTQMDYDTLMAERVLNPIQMFDTRIGLTSDQKNRLLVGYDKNNNVVPHWTFDIMGPALGMHTSAADMMRFLDLNIASNKNYFSDLLDYTHNSRLRFLNKNGTESEIALGWKIDLLAPDLKAVWQSGVTSGFASYIGFVETSKTGVFILSSIAIDVSEMGKKILYALELSQSKSNSLDR